MSEVLQPQRAVFPADRAFCRALAAGFAGRVRAGGEAVERQALQHAEVGVHTDHPVVVVAVASRLARHHDGADVRIAEDVAAHARHAVVLAGPIVGALALHAERAQADLAGAAGHAQAAVERRLRAGVGQADAAAEEEQQVFLRWTKAAGLSLVARDVAEVEDPGILEEELALLGEEQAELREVDLLFVGLGLCEVGVGGGIECQRRRQAGLHVEPGAAVEREVAAAERPHGAAEQVRLHADVAALGQVGQAGERAGRRRPHQAEGSGHRRPVGDFGLPADAAREVQAPEMSVARFETQRLEGDPELGGPALGRGRRGHPPHGVPVRVDVATFVGNLRVGAGAAGVGREDEAVTAIGEGVEQHLEGVLLGAGEVLADVVDDDGGGIGITAPRADVEELVVEGDIDFGGLGRRKPFARIRLDERVGRRGRLPHRVVENAVHRDRRRRAHGGERAPPVVRRHGERLPGRGGRGSQKGSNCNP